MRTALSLLFWCYLGTTLVLCWFLELVPWLLSAPFDPRRRFAHWYSWTWANHFHSISPFWRVKVEGAEKIEDDRAYVIAANHQSSLDILVMFALKKHFKWVAKHSLFYVPFFGWQLFMAGYVPIRRGDRKSRERMMSRCQQHLKSGTSIVVFPEGTRHEAPGLGKFKRGAFSMAIEADVPVVPVVLSGTRDCLPRNAWVTTLEERKQVVVSVLDPISPAQVDGDVRELQRLVRSKIADRLAELEPPAAAVGASFLASGSVGRSRRAQICCSGNAN